MTTSRILPIINVIGCFLVTGVVIGQWIKERRVNGEIKNLRMEITSTRENYEKEHKRAESLQGDVTQLKDSIEAMAKAKVEFEASLAKDAEEHNARMQAENVNAQEQIQLWQKAIADRDEVIVRLNSNLSATRARLDEAVSKLKKAGTQ